MALDHRTKPTAPRQPVTHHSETFQFPLHNVMSSESQAAKSTTPRTTPSLSHPHPQFYIKTEHRPSVHRSDSYQQVLQRERTVSLTINSNIEPQQLLNPDDEYGMIDEEDDDDEEEEVDMEKEEDEEDYCYGGYHPVQIGERFGTSKQYKIVRKLGWGHFSTVWLAFDELNDYHVAIKVVRSKSHYSQAALDEIRILEKATTTDPSHPGHKHLVKMYEWFYHEGPHGRHVCMVFEVLGQTTLGLIDDCKKSYKSSDKKKPYQDAINLLTLEKSYGGLPLSITKKITKQLLLALDYLHRSCGLIHTDIKPENILIEIKDVEKFVRCLKYESSNDRKKRHHSSASTTSDNSSRSRSARSHCRSNISRCQTPVQCSKPLPSPLSASTKLDFKDYFSSNYSLGSPTQATPTVPSPESRNARSQGSVNYYDETAGTYSTFSHDNRVTPSNSTSPSTAPTTASGSSHLTSLVISASEANSDDEDEDDDEQLEGGPFDVTYTVKPSRQTFNPTPMRSSLNHLHSRLSSISLEEPEDVSSLINIKLADLGNACYYNLHHTNDIQTRQYRSIEVLLGHRWGASTDMWSTACVIFELLTGDYLFDPKNGKHHDKNDDHIAQILELLNIRQSEMERFSRFVKESKYADVYFSSDGLRMKKIDSMKYWPLADVLHQKYKMEKGVAMEVSEFLLPMLAYDPKKRVDAGGWSNHPWLDDVTGCGEIKRENGTKGEDIKGWYKLYERSR